MAIVALASVPTVFGVRTLTPDWLSSVTEQKNGTRPLTAGTVASWEMFDGTKSDASFKTLKHPVKMTANIRFQRLENKAVLGATSL